MKKVKISLVLNIILTLFVITGTIFMFEGIKFMPDATLLEATKTEMLKFYTVDSNLLMGIVSIILIIYEIRFLEGKIKEIPIYVYIIKMIGTAGILLTFVTTLFFLSPMYGLYAMYNNANLIFHLIVPVLAFISYIVFEKYNNKYKYAFFGILPMFIYSIYYTSMILIHLNDGGLTYKYDFYNFLQGNINNIYIVVPIMYIGAYILSLLLILLNKKINNKN